MSAAQKLPETDAHFVAVEMPKPQPYVIAMTDDEFRLIENNIDGLRPLIHDAAETMDFIAPMLSYNTTSEDSPGVMAALRLAARGLKAQATPEFEALDTL